MWQQRGTNNISYTGIDYEIAKNIILKEKWRIKETRRDKRRFVKELYELHKTVA